MSTNIQIFINKPVIFLVLLSTYFCADIYRIITSIKRPLLLNAPSNKRLFETFCYFPDETLHDNPFELLMRTSPSVPGLIIFSLF